MTRWVCVLVVLGLAAPALAVIPTPTPRATITAAGTDTPLPATGTPSLTPTATPTLTGSPLAPARIKAAEIEWYTPAPTPPATPLCVYALRSDVLLPECLPLNNGAIGGTQRACVTTGSIPAATTANICVSWASPYSSAGVYSTIGQVSDSTTTSIAALLLHHTTPQTGSSACALIFNQDAANAHTGTVCLEAFPQ